MKESQKISSVLGGLFAALGLLSCLLPAAAAFQGTRGQVVRLKVEGGKEFDLYTGSYALVIGVSHYTGGWDDLPDVVNDVVEVKKALEVQGFITETVTNPTRAQFDIKVREFIARYGQEKDNRLLIYYSGHGHTLTTNDKGQRQLGYLVPADAPLPRSDNLGAFKSYAISMNEINNYAEQIEAKHVLFVFDSCFSGSIFKTRSGSVPEPIRDKTSEPVRQFITAGTEKQPVPAQSIFRRVFVQALGGTADLNRDGYITGMELGMFLHSEVTTQSKRMQTPQIGTILNIDLSQGDFVFVVAGQSPPAPSPVSLSPEDRDWRDTTIRDTAEAYRSHVQKYPASKYTNEAQKRLQELSRTQTVMLPDPAPSGPKHWEMVEEKSFIVPIKATWTPTAIQINAGQQVKVTGTSKQVDLGANGMAGPEGTYKDDPQRPLRDCQTGALIARVGQQMVCLGREATFTAISPGILYLGINEGRTADNIGTFVVNIKQYQLQ